MQRLGEIGVSQLRLHSAHPRLIDQQDIRVGVRGQRIRVVADIRKITEHPRQRVVARENHVAAHLKRLGILGRQLLQRPGQAMDVLECLHIHVWLGGVGVVEKIEANRQCERHNEKDGARNRAPTAKRCQRAEKKKERPENRDDAPGRLVRNDAVGRERAASIDGNITDQRMLPHAQRGDGARQAREGRLLVAREQEEPVPERLVVSFSLRARVCPEVECLPDPGQAGPVHERA